MSYPEERQIGLCNLQRCWNIDWNIEGDGRCIARWQIPLGLTVPAPISSKGASTRSQQGEAIKRHNPRRDIVDGVLVAMLALLP